MSQLPWTAYDDRGASWRRARTRGVALALALGLAAMGGLTSTAVTSQAQSTPTADLSLLAQRQAAEEHAVLDAFGARAAQVERDGAARVAGLTSALEADLAALDRAAAAAAATDVERKAAAVQQVAADRANEATQLQLRSVADRAAIEAFFTDVLTTLGPETRAPTRAALDTAKKQLENRRSAELSAVNAVHSAQRAALDVRVKAAVAALSAEISRLDDEHHAVEDVLAASLTATKDALAAELRTITTAIDAETVVIKQRHAQERLDLERIHDTQTAAAARATSAVRGALDDRQHLEEDQLKAAQANELAAQGYAKSAATQDEAVARRAAEDQRTTDLQAADLAQTTAETVVQEQKDRAAADGAAALRALQATQDARYASVKATWDGAVAGIGKGHAGVKAARTERLAKQVEEQAEAVAALDASTAVKRKDVETGFEDRASTAKRKLGQDRDARERRHRKDLRLSQWQVKKDLGTAERDRDRQLRLVRSEYFTLKIRAVAFSEDPLSYVGVGSAFDPATDPGSLWNVAKRIGATDVPTTVTGAGVDVALIDTGVVDAPGLAEADVEIGPDFSFEDVVPELRGRDTMGHGTHLGGIIAARDDAWNAGNHERSPQRLLGVAPGSRLVSVKAGSADGSVDVTQVIAAINWVIKNKRTDGRNIRVLNLSYGTDGTQDPRIDPLSHAVERAWRAGIVVVVAGGNDGWSAGRLTNPAQDPLVLAVGSSQAVDGKEDVPSAYSEGSSTGRGVDLSAPGRSIASVRNVGASSDAENLAGRVGDRLVRGSGTSQAAAVVSGAAALLLSARPELTPDQVKHVLMATADRPEDSDAGLAGNGYLRIDRALKAAVPYVKQAVEPSTGTGTLDGARGSVRVVRDGIALEGEFDVFGTDWSGRAWSEDSWSGRAWSGRAWSGRAWSGAGGEAWTGTAWSSDAWAGRAWSGRAWSGEFWSGAVWTGRAWSGRAWSGRAWSASGWFGVGWDDGPSETAAPGGEPVTQAAVDAAAATP